MRYLTLFRRLVRSPGESHIPSYLLAYGCIPLALHRVADPVPVIVHYICHHVTMRIVRSIMPGDKILRIFVSHSLQMCLYRLHHHLVCQLVCIFGRPADSKVLDRVRDLGVKTCLHLETLCYVLHIRDKPSLFVVTHIHTLISDDLILLLFTEHTVIVHYRSCETCSCRYLHHHSINCSWIFLFAALSHSSSFSTAAT